MGKKRSNGKWTNRVGQISGRMGRLTKDKRALVKKMKQDLRDRNARTT